MFRRILVASDLSTQSSAAFRHARGLGTAFGSAIIVAHVVEMPSVLRRWGSDMFREDLKAYDALLERQLAAAEAQLERQVTTAGLTSPGGVKTVVRSGVVAQVLADLVDELDSDLIIVARGKGGKLGPVAELLVRLVGRTVMVAPVRGPSKVTLDRSTMTRPPRSRRRAAA